ANWINNLSLAEARALDRACADGARNGATSSGLGRVTRGGDDTFDFVFSRQPATEESAAALREMADARVAAAAARDPGNRELAWSRESARRAVADRERHEAAARAERERVAEAFDDRVQAEADRRIAAMKAGKGRG